MSINTLDGIVLPFDGVFTLTFLFFFYLLVLTVNKSFNIIFSGQFRSCDRNLIFHKDVHFVKKYGRFFAQKPLLAKVNLTRGLINTSCLESTKNVVTKVSPRAFNCSDVFTSQHQGYNVLSF